MNFFDHDNQFTSSQPVARGFMPRVFSWMFAGLFVSGITAYICAPQTNPALFKTLASGPLMWLMFLQMGIIFFHSYKWQSLSYGANIALFLTYSGLTGITLSPLLYIYTGTSLLQTFFVAAGTFGTMAVYGAVTGHDLSRYSSLLTMGLFGVVIAMLINMFVKSGPMNLVISAVGALLFTVLTAYDVQKLRYISHIKSIENDTLNKLSIMGAMMLYLDLINLFLFLLQLLGERRRK